MFLSRRNGLLGSRYKKAVYREYVDGTFKTPKNRTHGEEHLGILGKNSQPAGFKGARFSHSVQIGLTAGPHLQWKEGSKTRGGRDVLLQVTVFESTLPYTPQKTLQVKSNTSAPVFVLGGWGWFFSREL